ncbi:outer membrane protein assembly factor BamB family protein [Dictyobacter kobayashii]|uniref:Pyrrolo-quinoline quinone repeat domain-containing protein n=1 Tax=Dictyobacter kobayashii TaxID=2014872 RepID=A0A402ANG9_9CHLR|nr:PQQ-binding-like beta-propeller repeat protein [Dictyobacter kobayashii]GCE20741.1 hypothetical protein KDK_45410 [Dictyobacter kobayashii]
MDYRPEQQQRDQSDIEVEITDLDAEEAGNRAAGAARFESILASFVRHARLWSALVILVGCVIIAIQFFPAVASFVKPAAPSSTTIAPGVKPELFSTAAGADNVTFAMGWRAVATTTTAVSVTAYDTQNGALLWHGPQTQSSTTTYGLVGNQDSYASNIYALRSDGLVSLLAPRTGKVIWSYKLPSSNISPHAIEQANVLFFSDSDNSFYAVKDGRLLWHNVRAGTLLTIENGVVYSYNSAQQIYYALKEESGARLWSYAVPHSTPSPSQTVQGPTIVNNILYVQTFDNKLLAIQSQDHVLWSHNFNGPVTLQSDAHHLYVIDQVADTIDVFNPQTGNIERTFPHEAGAINIEDIQNNMLYIQADEGMRAVNAETGKIVWRRAIDVNQPKWISNGVIYMYPLQGKGSIQAINEKDNTVLWSAAIKGQVFLGGDDNVLDLVSTDNSTLSVLRLSDGKILWSKHIS